MFQKFIQFFIENYKLNYALFLLVFAAGIYSYTLIPKEVTPEIEPESITIRGSYSGASVDILNKMAVSEIEAECKNIRGIKTITSIISAGRFTMVLELEKRADKGSILNEVKDALDQTRSNLPDDMTTPTARSVPKSRRLMHLAILSSVVQKDKLKDLAKEFRLKLLELQNISDVTIYGDSDRFYEVLLDDKKLQAYGLRLEDISEAISQLSYIYPIGHIDDTKGQFYLSTANGKSTADIFANTYIIVDGKSLMLKDIALINKRYEDASTLASMNGKNSITLAISQDPKGDAIKISQDIKKLTKQMHKDGVIYDVRRDQSIIIKDRLNIIISNILVAILLITLLTYILINAKMAFIIFLGIPTSFVIGAIYFYFTGYSININTLIGVLIALGIIVDDAIVVSENIQQHIEEGLSPIQAAIKGSVEMAAPVSIATLTTLFSFIPLLMISGRLGEIIAMIPIAFSALVVASLIESFIFLPIHSVHLLRANSKTLSWQKANKLYTKVLLWFIKYQKSFLFVFVIIVPSIIYFGITKTKFQMFQNFDGASVSITFKADPNTPLEGSLELIQTIERDLLENRSQFFVKNLSSTAGYRRSSTGASERYPYVGYINIELNKKRPDNFLDRFVTPYVNFYYDKEDRIRDKSSQQISKELRKWLEAKKYKERFRLNDLAVVEQRMGHNKADIRVGVISDDYQKAIMATKQLKEEFAKIDGIKEYGDNVKLGNDEIKVKINAYGEKLGLNEAFIGRTLASMYLSKKTTVMFDDKELLDVKIKSLYKDDLDYFKSLTIQTKSGIFVRLQDVVSFKPIQTLETLVKDDGETNFFVYANVDPSIITESEAMEMLESTFDRLRAEGIRLNFKGEREQKMTLQSEMVFATLLSVTLIFLSLLYLFNSLRETMIIMSVIPFSLLGIFVGHYILGLNLSLPSLIGGLGLAGVIVNDGIIMMATLKQTKLRTQIPIVAAKRLRPIVLTSITTVIGLATLIFFPSSEAVTFQPLAVSLGFGLMWGTVLNLLYVPTMYNFLHNYKRVREQ
jgi:multidrug efflux pump subunit AcrB